MQTAVGEPGPSVGEPGPSAASLLQQIFEDAGEEGEAGAAGAAEEEEAAGED